MCANLRSLMIFYDILPFRTSRRSSVGPIRRGPLFVLRAIRVSNRHARLFRSLAFTYGQKLTLLASVPLVLAVAAIAALVALQARALAEREISTLETQLIEAKKAELRNYVTQARNGFYFIYGNAAHR